MEERIAEKKAKRREAEVAEEVKEKIVSAEEEKLRQRKLQEEADLVVAMETFGLASGGVLDSMDPKSNEEFDKFREALCDKITKYKVRPPVVFVTITSDWGCSRIILCRLLQPLLFSLNSSQRTR